ncbi:hypothetical protein EDC01DRAFT_663294 [Geopyxis carbonaria]|nr:hypothetical protein EDC01DRAFT_663294 [Geopyxis carbonaria]
MDPNVASRKHEIIGVLVPCLAITTLVFGVRLYFRLYVLRRFGNDDWWIVTAMASYIIYISFSLWQIEYGAGHHQVDIPPQDWEMLLKLAYILIIFGMLTPNLVKLSVLTVYSKLAQGRLQNTVIRIVQGFTAVTAAAGILIHMFSCQPVSESWNPATYPRNCKVSVMAVMIVQCAMNVITDIIVFVMPIPIICGLSLPRNDKIIVCVILPLGGISVFASIARLYYMSEIEKLWPHADMTWMAASNTIWGAVEACLGITACSLFALRQVWKRGWKKGKPPQPVMIDAQPSAHVAPPPDLDLWDWVSYISERDVPTVSDDAQEERGEVVEDENWRRTRSVMEDDSLSVQRIKREDKG